MVLEGWGESLLYPRLDDCIRLVKKEGAEAGLVTSGTGLDESLSGALLDAGIDFIGFSFSGTTARTHDLIRAGSDFERLVRSIRTFQAVRRRKGLKNPLKNPRMHLVYLLLRDNIEEAGGVIDLARDLEIKKIVLVNAVLIATRTQDEDRVFARGTADRRYGEILHRLADSAKSSGIDLVLPSLSPMESGICNENPLKNLYISAEGEVSPCVYLYPPVPSPFTRVHFGEEFSTSKVSFGNIFTQSFPDIWNSGAYRDFRKCFQERERVAQAARQALFGLEPGAAQDAMREMPAAPEACRKCHKLYGL